MDAYSRKNIESFVSFDIRQQGYKPAKAPLFERHKPFLVYAGFSAFVAVLINVMDYSEGIKHVTAVCLLLAFIVISLAYVFLTEITGYVYKEQFYNVTAVLGCIIVWSVSLIMCLWAMSFFKCSVIILIGLTLLSFVMASVVTLAIVGSRIKKGYYITARSPAKIDKVILFSIFIGIFYIGRTFFADSLGTFGYVLTLYATAGTTNCVLFYGWQLYYAKKYGLENLLPQVRYYDNEDEDKERQKKAHTKEPETMDTASDVRGIGSIGGKYDFGKKWGK